MIYSFPHFSSRLMMSLISANIKVQSVYMPTREQQMETAEIHNLCFKLGTYTCEWDKTQLFAFLWQHTIDYDILKIIRKWVRFVWDIPSFIHNVEQWCHEYLLHAKHCALCCEHRDELDSWRFHFKKVIEPIFLSLWRWQSTVTESSQKCGKGPFSNTFHILTVLLASQLHESWTD